MTERLLQFWIESDDDPSGIDWQAWMPKGIRVRQATVTVRTFPWNDIEHTITWWITRRLTLEEWNELDNTESEVLARIVGDGNFIGTAGPIPYPDDDETHAQDSGSDEEGGTPE